VLHPLGTVAVPLGTVSTGLVAQSMSQCLMEPDKHLGAES
jgi:hypothetical protein